MGPVNVPLRRTPQEISRAAGATWCRGTAVLTGVGWPQPLTGSSEQQVRLSASTQQFHFGLLGVWEVVTWLKQALALCPRWTSCHLHVSPLAGQLCLERSCLSHISYMVLRAPQPCDDQITSHTWRH